MAAATGVLAHALATNNAKDRRVRDRDYSNPRKFFEPEFASIKDMEAVSLFMFPELLCKTEKLKMIPGNQRNPPGNRRRRHHLS